MKSKKKINVFKVLTFIICLAFVILCLCFADSISAEKLAAITPRNQILAVLVLLFMFAVKSISIAFPLLVLQVASTLVLPFNLALTVNCAGVLIDLTIPYFLGRFSGIDAVERLTKKYRRLAKIVSKQQKNTFFFAYFLQVLSILPGDVISIYFGAIKAPYPKYLTAAFVGMMPFTFCATILGDNLTNTQSPLLKIAVASTAAIVVLSALAYIVYDRMTSKKSEEIPSVL